MTRDHFIGAFTDAETAELLRELAAEHDGNRSLTLRTLVQDAAQRAGILSRLSEQDKPCTPVQEQKKD